MNVYPLPLAKNTRRKMLLKIVLTGPFSSIFAPFYIGILVTPAAGIEKPARSCPGKFDRTGWRLSYVKRNCNTCYTFLQCPPGILTNYTTSLLLVRNFPVSGTAFRE